MLFADAGNIQSVIVFAEGIPIIRPGHTVFFQPTVTLEHTLGEDDIHIINIMFFAPDIFQNKGAAAFEKVLKIHLMQHAFHIRHTDLKRGMAMGAAKDFVDHLGVLFRNEAFAVKFGNAEKLVFLNAVIFAHTAVSRGILNGNHFCARVDFVIVHHNNAVRFININSVNASAARKHQSVIGIEFGKLANAEFHIHHNALTDRLVKILADKGEPCLAAHTGRAFKSNIGVLARAEVQGNSFGAEHRLCLLLP